MTAVKLSSDFVDYYDHFFDLDSKITLSRKMKAGPNRIEMYKMLNMIGLKTPKFGMVAELYKDLGSQYGGVAALKDSKYDQIIELVVYLDLNAHAGEGKVKLSLEEAREKYPGHFASQYIPTAKSFMSRTERLLCAGDHHFWMEYLSKDDWRSNAGEVTINELDVRYKDSLNGRIHEIKLPLFAIDFVAVGRERLAIDFNISPGIKGTPVEHMMSAEEMANSIKDRVGDLNGLEYF